MDTPPRGIERPDLREPLESRERLNLRTYAESEKGDEKDKNEDAFVVGNDYAAVFDGMGGPYGGDIASGLARDTLKVLMETLDPPETVEGAKEQVEKVIRQIQDRIVEKKNDFFQDTFAAYKEEGGENSFFQFLTNLRNEDDNILNMGTTGVVTRFVQDGDDLQAVVGSVGDSRGYVVRKDFNNRLESVTLDHSDMGRRRSKERARKLQDAFDDVKQISDLPEGMQSLFDRRHILSQSFGGFSIMNRELKTNHDQFNPRIYDVELGGADALVLTSDGIHDNLTRTEMEKTIEDALEQGANPAEALVRNAKSRSREYPEHDRAKDDDMTAVFVTSEDAKNG
jgi:serine/threonine protein phosphatase PrpC